MSGLAAAAGDRAFDARRGRRRHLVRQGVDRAPLSRVDVAAGLVAAKRRVQRPEARGIDGRRGRVSCRARVDRTRRRSRRAMARRADSSRTSCICSLRARGWARCRRWSTCFGKAQPIDDAAWATARFSRVAIACVSVLILSGIGNSWFLVGSVPALFGTAYGILLLAKLAPARRDALVRRGQSAGPDAAARRRRSAGLARAAAQRAARNRGRAAGGDDRRRARHHGAGRASIDALAVRAYVELGTRAGIDGDSLVAACRRARRRCGLAVLVAGARRRAWRRPRPASSASRRRQWRARGCSPSPRIRRRMQASPVRYTTSGDRRRRAPVRRALRRMPRRRRRGGADGRIGVRPPNLVGMPARHRPGELYWWIAHGRAGTAMPAFAPPLGSDEIWSIVQFLQALSDAADFAGTDAGLIARCRCRRPTSASSCRNAASRRLLRTGRQTRTRCSFCIRCRIRSRACVRSRRSGMRSTTSAFGFWR